MMGGAPGVHKLVAHQFCHQAGRMPASLTHIVRLETLELVEEVVQAASRTC
jgi:hypothetical protein